jgi:hypothetical protein
MFDSPFHYKYTQEEKIQISKQTFIENPKLKETKKTLKTNNEIINFQKAISRKTFLVEKSLEINSKFYGGGVSYFTEAKGIGITFNSEFSNGSNLIEIHCLKGLNKISLNQRFSGFSSINFIVEKNAELEINVVSEPKNISLFNLAGVNKGGLRIFSSNLAESHSDILFDIENHGSASIILKSVVFESLSVKGFDNLKGTGSGETKIKILLLGNNSSANLLPSAAIQSEKQFFSHSASIERINDEELFYLQTRGLERKNAEKMIWQGFLKNESTGDLK